MTISIFDVLGAYCGMHYYDMAFAEILRNKKQTVLIYSNFSECSNKKTKLPNVFSCGKFKGIVFLLYSYCLFLSLVLSVNKKKRIIYLTYGELYELPFLLMASLSNHIYVDVHEIHALKYKDDSKISKLFEIIYKKCINNVIFHSQRTFDVLKADGLRMMYVPHFKYVFKKTYDENQVADDMKICFLENRRKFLFFGNLSTVKGIDTVLDVFKNMDESLNYELVIAGKNVEKIDFSSIASDKIKVFDRHINDDELVYLYSKTDYILLPYKKSSQSGIFAMAAYFHKPMLLSDIPYFRLMIEEFPSFGKLSKMYNFKELVTKSVNEDLSSYYSPNDIERFEMKKEIDHFLNNFLTEN